MRVYMGIDWSQLKHDYCLLDEQGRAIQHGTIPHRPDGFETLDQARSRIVSAPDECWVGLETAHTLVIDWLWARGYSQMFVIPPGSVNRARGRYRQTQAHTDQSDAYVIADMVRTDQARLVPWHPDSALTRRLRAKVGLLGYLTRESVRTAEFLDEYMRRIGILAGRWASMEEVADAVVFLASDQARYINGTELPVDGGYSVNAR